MDDPLEELFILEQLYNDTTRVWLPIMDHHASLTSGKEESYNRLASKMPWYSLHHPSLLEPAVIKYIRDIWQFDKKSFLVMLDSQGKVVCPNALHMIWIWKNFVFFLLAIGRRLFGRKKVSGSSSWLTKLIMQYLPGLWLLKFQNPSHILSRAFVLSSEVAKILDSILHNTLRIVKKIELYRLSLFEQWYELQSTF